MPSPPLLVALALLSNAPAMPDQKALEQVYAEGQERFEEGDYAAAAEAFERLFSMVPESRETWAIRQNVAINVVTAWFSAYDRQLGPQGKDITYLERAGKPKSNWLL